MSGDLVRVDPCISELAPLVSAAREYVDHAKSANTKRAYRNDWKCFSGWCAENGQIAMPAEPATVALYLTARAETHAVATLTRRLAAISQAHQAAGHHPPTREYAVRMVLAGIRRAKGTAQASKTAIVTSELLRMVEALPDTLLGIRDRCLLVMDYAGCFRRSEVVSLDRADVTVGRDGLTAILRRSKTDQEGKGYTKGLPYGSNPDTCPVRTLQDWLKGSGIKKGPLFRPIDRHGRLGTTRLSDRAVALIIKRTAAAAGLDPANYAGHSLRRGFCTEAGARGVAERNIMRQSGHRTEKMVRRYIEDGKLFRDNPAGQVGL